MPPFGFIHFFSVFFVFVLFFSPSRSQSDLVWVARTRKKISAVYFFLIFVLSILRPFQCTALEAPCAEQHSNRLSHHKRRQKSRSLSGNQSCVERLLKNLRNRATAEHTQKKHSHKRDKLTQYFSPLHQ